MQTIPREMWPLMALTFAPNGELSPVQMQKALFLMTEQAGEALGDKPYEFVPHNYGPFCAEVYRDIDALNAKGRMGFLPNHSRPWNSYVLTSEGRETAGAALDKLDPQIRGFLRSVVEWVAELDFPDLLRAVYDKYPDYAVNSVFRGQP